MGHPQGWSERHLAPYHEWTHWRRHRGHRLAHGAYLDHILSPWTTHTPRIRMLMAGYADGSTVRTSIVCFPVQVPDPGVRDQVAPVPSASHIEDHRALFTVSPG